MGVNWTEKQLEAINAKGENILVSAAAGSGKTAVLVERVIRKITDPENPIPIDRLLVLTFTEAAASEMKQKITAALEKEMRKDPENKFLKEQIMKAGAADISNVHSFCKKMISNNVFSTAGDSDGSIPTDFSIIPETENEILLKDALDDVLERYYSNIDDLPSFRGLVLGYGGVKSDGNLRDTALGLYKFINSMASPKRWLRDAVNIYKEVSVRGGFSGTKAERLILGEIRKTARELLECYDYIERIVDDNFEKDRPHHAFFAEERLGFEHLYSAAEKGIGEFMDAVRELKFKSRLPGVKKDDDYHVKEAQEQIKFYRDIAKKRFSEEFGKYKTIGIGELEDRYIKTYPLVKTLKNIVLTLRRRHIRLKREKGYLDFSDLEHEFINLISDKDGNPTRTALKLREKYEEILVDEYQDTNNIQDTIFKLLSRGNNIFMVGDLKQSIYKFRNASPKLFAEKYERYGKGDGGRLICLTNNFRSRKTVVDTVNGIFEKLMSKRTCDTEYGEDERLVFSAGYLGEDTADCRTELLLTDCDPKNYEAEKYSGYDKYMFEAETVARRIYDMVNVEKTRVYDKETGEKRRIKYGDISILMRSVGAAAPVFEQIFEDYGIPVRSEKGRGYLDSVEVMTVMNFLRIIDNPLQDIPLIAVMRSPIFAFTPDALAEIRMAERNGNFYYAVVKAAENGMEQAAEFLDVLNKLRDEAEYMGIDEIVWKIVNDLNYGAIASAAPGGEQAAANLKLLFERAAEFERGSMSGLFNFMKYIDGIKDEADLTPAKLLGEDINAVNIVTIHKSKGLEYPVVFVANMDTSVADKAQIVWHEDLGIGLDYVDPSLRVRYPGLMKALIKAQKKRENTAEEMRLLYVAATRAKEKLIFSARKLSRGNGWEKAVYAPDGALSPVFINRYCTLRDWTLPALARHKDADGLKNTLSFDATDDKNMDFAFEFKYVNHETEPLEYETEKAEGNRENVSKQGAEAVDKSDGESRGLPEELRERLEYRYPTPELAAIPVKMSVSEVKSIAEPESEYVPVIKPIGDASFRSADEIDSKSRGSITHYVIQHIDIHRTDTLEEIEKQLDEMTQNGIINSKQRSVVSSKSIYSFYGSGLGKRLKKAERVENEFKFYVRIKAKEIYPELDTDAPLLLQGIADCFFFEEDGIVLIDYKTDNVSRYDVKKRSKVYSRQIEYYSRGISEIFDIPVKEKYLYFLEPSAAVSM